MSTEPLVGQFLTVKVVPCQSMLMPLKSSHVLTPRSSGLPELYPEGFRREEKELYYE